MAGDGRVGRIYRKFTERRSDAPEAMPLDEPAGYVGERGDRWERIYCFISLERRTLVQKKGIRSGRVCSERGIIWCGESHFDFFPQGRTIISL